MIVINFINFLSIGLIVKCPHCKCDFMDQKWLDDHECEKAPIAGPKAPPSGGKKVPESTTPSTSNLSQNGASKESEERPSSASSSISASTS